MRFNTLILIAFVCAFGALSLPQTGLAQDYNALEEQEPEFLSAMGDIPLMEGLQELDLDTMVFDKPGGRIGESTAVGKGIKAADIAQFYRKTLPQLGWRNVAPNVFVREGEVLEIEAVDSGEYGAIHFSVKPQ